MKKILKYALPLALVAFAAASCQEEKMSEVSVIKTSSLERNAFDDWLEVNFLKPYNIDFKYRYELYESNMAYYTVPADYEASIYYAYLIKYLCVDAYDEIAGIDFTKGYFPKLFFLIGTWEYNNTGTITLGTAEGGKKIFLSGVNNLPWMLSYYSGDDRVDMINTYYIKTIHHEFTHILNQTKDYPENFRDITSGTYVNDSWNDSNENYLQLGYISAYSRKEPREDFAELLSEYITHTAEWWQAQMTAAGTEGATLLESKFDIVRTYFNDVWNIDVDELRDIINRRSDDVVRGNRIDIAEVVEKIENRAL